MDSKPKKQETKVIDGQIVLDHVGGDRFYHKHLSPKAQKKKAQGRAQARRSRQRNRRKK